LQLDFKYFEDIERKEWIIYIKGEIKAFTGIRKDYYDNVKLAYEGNYKNENPCQ